MKVMFFLAKQRHRFNGTLTDSICLGKGKALRRTLRKIILSLRSVIGFLVVFYGQKDLNEATDLRDQLVSRLFRQIFAFLLQFLIRKILNLDTSLRISRFVGQILNRQGGELTSSGERTFTSKQRYSSNFRVSSSSFVLAIHLSHKFLGRARLLAASRSSDTSRFSF